MTQFSKASGSILLITGFAYFLAQFTPTYLNSIMLALLLGIIAGNSLKFSENISDSNKRIGNFSLEFSIVFLAFDINYSFILALGFERIIAIILVVFTLLFLTFYLAQKLKHRDSNFWLIGIGTAICGSSAIAAVSPILSKNKEDVGISLAVINLYGAIGMLTFPFLLNLLHLNVADASFIIGGSLHSVGNVLGAGYAMSDEIGQTALTVKMARVALLSPVILFLLFKIKPLTSASIERKLVHLPWYLVAFIVISSIVSLITLPNYVTTWTELMGKLVLTIAMSAIGLNIKLRTLANSGKKGLAFGFVIFIIQLALLGIFVG
jgi:uncharacterized integral membrane protein (TIGR00698 family)